MSNAIFEISLEDKLYRTKYEPDTGKSHIQVNQQLCQACVDKPCTFACPAKVYTVDANDQNFISVSHENCLECGTCIQVCLPESVDWKNPDGGIGVKYRFG